MTQENLEKIWDEYAQTQKHNERLYEIMTNRKLVLVDQNNFELKVSNIYIDTELMPFKTNLLKALREASGHYQLQMRTAVEASEKISIPYTGPERYDALRKINPELAFLKQYFPIVD